MTTSMARFNVGAVLALLVLALLPAVARADHRLEVSSGDLVTSVRWAGETRYDTAAKLAVEATPSSIADASSTAILATGANFPDALAGTYLAGLVDAPILLTERDNIPTSTMSVLTGTSATSLDVDRVYLLGGPLAIGLRVQAELEALGIDVVRLAGENRMETAARIATGIPDAEVGLIDGLRTAIVARADSFPDALVAGAAARNGSLPMLLTATESLSSVTADALDRLNIEQVIVAGGPVAVSDAVVTELAGLGYQPRRVFGNSRTETAVSFSNFNQQELGFRTNEVGLARADSFPDALAFAPFAGREAISVLLARDPLTLDVPTRTQLANYGTCFFDTLYIPGGTVAISAGVEAAARESLTTDDNCNGVDNTGPVLAAAALDSLGTAGGGRALPGPTDDVITAVFNESVICSGGTPEQFTLIAGSTLTDALSVACGGSRRTDVVLGFPGGTITTLKDVVLRYRRAGDAVDRILDLSGNDAETDQRVNVLEALIVNTAVDAPDADLTDDTCAIADGGRCSLRAAIQEANVDPDETLIVVPDGTFRLTVPGLDEEAGATGDLDLRTTMVIVGGGETIIEQTVAGERVLDVRSGTASLSGLTITGGDMSAADGKGGGLRQIGGTTALEDMVVTGNTAGLAGGGIENSGATMTLVRVTLDGNEAGANGGGLHVTGDGTTTITDSEVMDNLANLEGGGVWNGTGTMTLVRTTFTDNVAEGAAADQGGGSMFNAGGTLVLRDVTSTGGLATGAAGSGGALLTDGGSASVTESVFEDNAAARAGGGIENAGGTVTVTDSTLRGNDAGSAPGNGGAIHAGGGTTTVTRVLAESNTAVEGGAYWVGGDGEFLVDNGIVRTNRATGGDAATAGARQGGGGAYNDGATLTVVDATFAGNLAITGAGSGGGILNAAGDLIVDNATFDRNRADRAGGAIENDAGTLTVGGSAGVTFTENRATGVNSAGNGGAIHTAGEATVAVTDIVARANVAVEGGGFWIGAGSTATLTDGTWEANRATGGDAATAGSRQGGGGVYNDGGDLVIDGGSYLANTATTGNGSGGGILSAAGTTTIDGARIAGNLADRAGGGIEFDGGDLVLGATTPVTIENNVATGTNSGAGNGGGLHTLIDLAITGNTFRGNSAVEGGGLWVGGGVTLALSGTNLIGNIATGSDASVAGERQGGGGVYNSGAILDIDGAEFLDNVAITGAGSGGAVLTNGAGTTTIDGSTFTTNVADRAGGAVENDGGQVDIGAAVPSTFSGNIATGATSAGNGGAVHAAGGTTTIVAGAITGGSAKEGGGVWVGGNGTMTLSGVNVQANEAVGPAADQGGGGLFVTDTATLTATANTVVAANNATGAAGSGGGALNDGGTLTLQAGVQFNQNTANRAGGAIEVTGGTTTLTRVTMTGNAADGGGSGPGSGGGIHVTGSTAALTVTESSFVGNAAAADGGGLWNGAATIAVTRSTFEANTAVGEGGGVYDQGGATTLSNVTLSANSAASGGGAYATTGGAITLTHVTSFQNTAGIGNELAIGGASAGTMTVRNSIVVDGGAGNACAGASIASTGGNYAEASCAFGGPNDQAGTAPALAALAITEGSPTRTHQPNGGSPVIDATTAAGLTVDQRGVTRPQNPILALTPYDSGAVEVVQGPFG